MSCQFDLESLGQLRDILIRRTLWNERYLLKI